MGVALLSRAIVSGVGLIIVGILTRTLGPEGFGHYSAIFAYLYLFGIVADMGLYTIMVREISRPDADEDSIASRIFSLRLALSFAVVVAGIVIAFFLPYEPVIKMGIAVAALSTIFQSLIQVLMGVFQKHLRLYLVSIADIVMRLVQLGLIMFLLKTTHISVVWFAATSVGAEAVHFVLVWYFTRRLSRIALRFDMQYWKDTMRTAFPVAASLVFVLIYFKLDTVILSLMKPAYDVGVYSVAYKLLELIIFLPAMYLGLIMPLLSRHAFDREKFAGIFQKTFDILSIFAAPALGYCYVFAGPIIHLIGGADFQQSVGVLQILSLAIFLIFFGNLGGNALVALNLQNKGMWIYGFGAVFNLVANLVLIPHFTYYAAAWTTVLTEFGVTIAMLWVIHRERRIFARFEVLAKSLIATALMVALVMPFSHNLIIGSAVALAYFPILFVLGGFSRADIREIIKPNSTISV
ncbi:MAG: hypothetical protein A3A33_00670 [Candidatus Yanofskybacteria bacterium RIFCSPLOWO2_01_FULL_49_25]|uniref:Uncharacterized protein n=1 Tax=Candidatus Yanofskybacteria bacterium RIFCSPLOWO2_01_FULL_49_25 TaxID=1802701 RepID=A0A1F8GWL7_9BACT|nr:MAG: hypothetical protein A3A33_00670 [Candidatus Yanofskybacteria bacterium RIFCSPLOWO2_01_FULL_49_25]